MSDYDRDMDDLDDRGRGRGGRGGFGGPGGPGGRFGPRRSKVCNFCLDKIKEVPYKDSDLLRRYLTDAIQASTGAAPKRLGMSNCWPIATC